MSIEFIDLVHTNSKNGHTSFLSIGKRDRDQNGNAKHFCVGGVLSHGSTFRPKTAKDCDNLVRALMELDYSDEDA